MSALPLLLESYLGSAVTAHWRQIIKSIILQGRFCFQASTPATLLVLVTCTFKYSQETASKKG